MNLTTISDITNRMTENPAIKLAEKMADREQNLMNAFKPVGGVMDSLRKLEEGNQIAPIESNLYSVIG